MSISGEGDAVLLAPREGLFVAAVGERVAILHADDGDDLAAPASISAGVTSLRPMWRIFPCSCIWLEGAEGFFERRARVDAVELVELDALELEAAQAHFDALDQVAGAANVFGLRRALARDAALGGDDEAGGIGVQSFAMRRSAISGP